MTGSGKASGLFMREDRELQITSLLVYLLLNSFSVRRRLLCALWRGAGVQEVRVLQLLQVLRRGENVSGTCRGQEHDMVMLIHFSLSSSLFQTPHPIPVSGHTSLSRECDLCYFTDNTLCWVSCIEDRSISKAEQPGGVIHSTFISRIKLYKY